MTILLYAASYNREHSQVQKPKVPIPTQPAEKALPKLEDQHRLKDAWTLSFAPPRARDVNNYENSMTELANFETRPSKVDLGTDFYLFKKGIKPMWEDPSNGKGGRITFRLAKHRSSKAWEELVLAAIGGKLQPSEEICGLVIGVRYISTKNHHNNPHGQPSGEDVMAIWTKDAGNKEAITSLTDEIRRILKLQDHVSLDYKEHDSARRKAIEVAEHQAAVAAAAAAAAAATTEGVEADSDAAAAAPAATAGGDNFW